MNPTPPGEGPHGVDDEAGEQLDAEASATSGRRIGDDRRYSGRAFVLVMVALMAVIAAGLFFASRSV